MLVGRGCGGNSVTVRSGAGEAGVTGGGVLTKDFFTFHTLFYVLRVIFKKEEQNL